MNLTRLADRLRTKAQEIRFACWTLDPAGSRYWRFLAAISDAWRLLDTPYEQIFTHLTPNEKHVLYLLSARLGKGATIVEVGSFLGASACFMALGLKKSGKIYCVDTWNNEAMDEPERDTFAEFEALVRPLRQAIIPLRGQSIEVAKKFSGTVDLLFIDADHAYDACLSDWKAWSQFLADGAVVVFHDTGWAKGVVRVVEDHVVPRAKKVVRMRNMFVAWL